MVASCEFSPAFVGGFQCLDVPICQGTCFCSFIDATVIIQITYAVHLHFILPLLGSLF
jgi:hypothetical protein